MFLSSGPSKTSDSDLINRFRSGNDDALGELFIRYSALVYGVCLKYLRDREGSKDAVMQIFEKLNHSLKTHQVENFKAWLYTLSKNHCLMHLRAQKNQKPEDFGDHFMESPFSLHQDDWEEKEQDLNKLEACIQQLKNDQKVCVELFYLKELCYQQIANKIGLELKKVKSHIQNGKRNLKICMEQRG